MNVIAIDGNLTRDPEIKNVTNGATVMSFSVANNDIRKKGENGEWENIPCFIDCEFWPKNVSFWSKKLYKGAPVALHGRLKQDRWQAEDGTNRSKIKIVVQGFASPILKNDYSVASEQSDLQRVSQDDDLDIPF
jgi:single-strand DNA-binding protein